MRTCGFPRSQARVHRWLEGPDFDKEKNMIENFSSSQEGHLPEDFESSPLAVELGFNVILNAGAAERVPARQRNKLFVFQTNNTGGPRRLCSLFLLLRLIFLVATRSISLLTHAHCLLLACFGLAKEKRKKKAQSSQKK